MEVTVKINDIITEAKDTLKLPEIDVGDEVKVGKFKNRKAEVTGFDKDEHGQPVLKTTKGDQKLFKPRVSKLEPEQVNEINVDHHTTKSDFDRYDLDEFIGSTKVVTKIGSYEIHLMDDDAPEEYIWMVGDPDSEGFLGYLSFSKGAYAGNDFYKSNVFFDETLQGKGLAIKLYTYAIKSSGITLVSDKTQTHGSKSVWAKLSQQPGIHVYGWDVNKYLKLPKARKDEAFFHWDPNTDLDDEVYADAEADAEDYRNVKMRAAQLHQDMQDGKISKQEHDELLQQMNKDQKAKDNQNVWGSDIRLVATADVKATNESSKNYGIPDGASLAQLDKIASTSTNKEKRERAHFLRNMKRGRNKK